MRNILARLACAAPLGALAIAASPALAGEETVERGEAELAKLLEGRVAGEPVNCLRRSQRDRMTIVDDTAFVFRDGDTIYVNRPGGARFLSDWDIPVFEPFGSRLCALDRVEMRDRSTFMNGPVLTLSEFIPYTRAKTPRPTEGG